MIGRPAGPSQPRSLRLGAVGYLNARPLVFGLDCDPRFLLRFDVPARCAELLHGDAIDVGLIPSIEYLRGDYRVVPDLAIASLGPVASVALYTRRPVSEIRSIGMDTSSRTSVALVRVLCARLFGIHPTIRMRAPSLEGMLRENDAALLIGDNALMLNGGAGIEKIDLGDAWTTMTGLPFVYALWVGRAGALTPEDVQALQRARDDGVRHSEEIARQYFSTTPEQQAVGARYLRENIKYHLGDKERAGLELFYRYAAEVGLAGAAGQVRFY